MILFIDACMRDCSRTREAAEHLLSRFEDDIQTVRLSDENIMPLDSESVAFRSNCTANEVYDDPMFGYAKQFAQADTVVIAAPYWDLSFPAALRTYLEHIQVHGITFVYSPEGIPTSLCRAEKLFYVSTAGGPVIGQENLGFSYIKLVGSAFWGIKEFELIQGEMLDVIGKDPVRILEEMKSRIDSIVF